MSESLKNDHVKKGFLRFRSTFQDLALQRGVGRIRSLSCGAKMEIRFESRQFDRVNISY